MEQMFNKFLWGETNDETKMHWASWNLCDILGMKMESPLQDFKIYTRNSLLLRDSTQETLIPGMPCAKSKNIVDQHILWKICRGNVSAWQDN